MESGGYWSGYRRTAYGRHFTTIRISKWLFDGMRQKQITGTIQDEEEVRKLRGWCLTLNHGYITPPHPDDCVHPFQNSTSISSLLGLTQTTRSKMAPSAITETTEVSPLASYKGYDHVHWYVGNAKQAASYYITRMGFERLAYRGLETGNRSICSHVIRNGSITFILTSPLRSLNQLDRCTAEEQEQLREIHRHLEQHGDGVKDVAFEVDSVDAVFGAALKGGAKVVSRPRVLEDESGKVTVATIQTYGQTTHTLLERRSYRGAFLPGYRLENGPEDPICRLLPGVHLNRIDHCVGNQDWDEMDQICE